MLASSRSRSAQVPAVLATVSFGVFLAVQHRWFPHLSRNNDEAVYLFQADLLRHGNLTLPLAEIGRSFRPWMSGILGDRVVMVFPPGWPAVLAVGVAVAGVAGAKVVGALAAAAAVVAVYALAREIGGDRATGVVAGAFVALSPLLLVLGGTVLSYPFALGLGATVGAATLRAIRLGRARPLVVGGLAAGALFATRPLDAALVAFVFGLHLLWTWRRRPLDLLRGAGAALVGAAPVLVLVAASNLRVTGSPFRFPLHANGGDNRMGFGPRRISAEARVFDVTPEMMREVTLGLLGELPRWSLGGLVVAPLVALGLVRLWRRRPALVPLLLALAVAFPVAYFFYWGTYFVHVGRGDFGPFYYLPMLVPVAVATAEGLRGLFDRWRPAAALAVAAVLATLPASLAPKAERAEEHTVAVAREVRLVAQLPEPNLVILPSSEDGPWMLHVRGYFANPADLRGPRLYAADNGAENIAVFERFRGRHVHQLFGVLRGDRVEGLPTPTLQRLSKVQGDRLTVETRFTNTTDNPTVVAYLGLPTGFLRCVLDEESARGRTYSASWTVAATGAEPPAGCTVLPPVSFGPLLLNGGLVVGFSAAATTDLEGVNRWEYLYAFRPAPTPALLVPGVPRRTSAGDLGDPRADYPGQVDHVLSVAITSTGTDG